MPIRDLLLAAIVLGMLPFAVRRTWIGILLWTWLSIMNPHRMTYGFAFDTPFAAMVAVAVLISVLFNKDNLKMPWDGPVVCLLLFAVLICVSTVFAFDRAGSSEQLNKVLKIQLMTAIAFVALRERKHIELFVWVTVLSIGFFGFKGGIFTILGGGAERVWGPPGSFIEGNNEIGLALVMTIPLMNYLRLVAERQWVRTGMLVLMLLCAVAALGTQSRGAFLALGAMGAVLWLRSPRKVVGGIAIFVVGVALISFMPDSWESRMRTIGNYEQDSSAMGRINAWNMAFNLANENFVGGGFQIYSPEVFARYAPDPLAIHAAHSIYFQVLGEHGYIGLLLFLLIFGWSYRMGGAIRKTARRRPETYWLYHLAGMCQVSLVGYAVGGAFLSLSYFDLPYNIVVVLVVATRWMREDRWKFESAGAFGAKRKATEPVAAPTRVTATT